MYITHTPIYIYIYTHVHQPICIYMYIYVYMFIYIRVVLFIPPLLVDHPLRLAVEVEVEAHRAAPHYE